MTRRPLPLILLLTLTGCGPGNPPVSQPEARQPVEKAIRRLDGTMLAPEDASRIIELSMESHQIQGLAVAALNEGHIVYLRGFGERAPGLPMTVTTAVSGASVSKALLACLALQLGEEGVLGLDQTLPEILSKPLPSYQRYHDLSSDERWRELTPRMLLSHTGGLPNWRWLSPDRKLRFLTQPGTRYAYSGEGIALLQLALEERAGQSLEELMQDRLFGPLGMSRTSMVWRSMFERDFAVGFHARDDLRANRRWDAASAAGSVTTTISDMAVFLEALLNESAMSAEARETMLSPQVRIRSAHQFPTDLADTTDRDDAIRLSYGLGWGLFWSPYGKAFFKEGHDDGWQHYMVAFEESRTALILMANSSNGERAFPELLSHLIGDDFTPSAWNRYGPLQDSQ